MTHASILAAWLVTVAALVGPVFGADQGSVEVFFSPRGGCTSAAVREIENAKSTILVQAYSFTSEAIADALLAAGRRGVDVRVIVDRSQVNGARSQAVRFPAALVDDRHPIAHNKILIVDGATVLTGSFNFTRQAEEGNAENLVILRGAAIAARYVENWNRHAEHSRPLRAEGAAK